MVGTYAARTLAAGAWHSPANIVLKQVVAVNTPMESEAALFFRSQLNLIQQQPAGFVSMSSQTLSSDREYLEVNVRRLMILIRRLAIREGMDDVFEPNDPAFRRRIQRHFDAVLGDLFVRGAFAGDTPRQSFRVVTDESVNKPESLEAGRFIVELRVAPSEPLDFLIVRLLQTGSQVLLREEKVGGR
jgi:phage tail sheath protein FI